MKSIMIICPGIFIVLFLTSCVKNSNIIENTSNILFGKWNLVYDSTFVGVGAGNHSANYIGKAGDYFDFRTDGKVYTSENSILDTLNYHFTSGSTIIIQSFGLIFNGVPEVSNITTITAHNATIDAPDSYTPGGIFGRTVELSR